MKKFNEFASKIAGQASSFAEKAADTIGEITDSNLEERGPQYCSFCFERHTCTPVESSNFSRNVYSCDGCGNFVVKCRVCDSFAKYREKGVEHEDSQADDPEAEVKGSSWGWENQFCSVHSGSIANFQYLNEKLDVITDYQRLFERSGRDFKKIGTTAAGVTGGAAIVAPLAFLAAPAAGAAIGSSAYGLSGAAATSKGLAVLGGGSLASGGLGMAGGVAVVTATGSALGGRSGAIIANGYYGDIEGFEIEPMTDGEGSAVLCINGFLTEGDEKTGAEWLKGVIRRYPENPIMHVKWESKRLRELAESVGGVTSRAAGWHAMSTLGKRGLKTAAKKASPVGAALSALGVASNPWSVARVKAAQTGALLADLIARTDQRYILVGHSLGARVIYFCLRALAETQGRQVAEAHLLGGAIDSFASDNQRDSVAEEADEVVDWAVAASAVDGMIKNYYSMNDDVLKYAYTVGELFRGSPVGRTPIVHPEIKNFDVTTEVEGHSEYIGRLRGFLESGEVS